MVDSGAYSAWKSDIEIDPEEYLNEYIDYIFRNAPYLDTYVVLDIIPGTRGCSPEESAQQSYANLKYMEERGLSPIPVFHQGERWYWLKRLIDEGYSYIGISPDNDRTTKQKQIWLDEVFEIVPSSTRTHAFGMTQVDLLFRFPFYSCDSMTWFIAAANGGVLVPKQLGPKKLVRLLLDRQPDIIKVTEGTRHHRDHYDKLPGTVQFICRRYLSWATSFTLKQLDKCYIIRSAANLRICGSYEKALIRHHEGRFGRWIYAVNTNTEYNALLSGISTSEHDDPPADDENWFDWPPDGGWGSGELGYYYGVPFDFFQPNRLLSYWLIKEANKDKDSDFLRDYVRTGLIEGFELRDKLGNPFQPRFDPRRLPQS
jgi:hypothetical protein